MSGPPQNGRIREDGLSARVSISRALGRLQQRGLLAPHVDPQWLRFSTYKAVNDSRKNDEADTELRGYLSSPYCLTVAGLATGRQYELPPIRDLDRRLWLLMQGRKPAAPSEWRLKGTLRSARLRAPEG